MNIFLQLIFSFFLSSASDFPKHFIPLTDLLRKVCSEDSQCVVTQAKNGEKYQLLFSKKTDKADIWLQSLTIKNIKTKEVERFKLPSEKRISMDEATPLFVVDINNDGYHDLALQSGLSAQKGFVYYYWVYNPKNKTFVLSKESLPALKFIAPKNIASLSSKESFRLDDTYQLVEASKKDNKPVRK
jgi:hypothetical protein